jgi:signal transduction histidine kinase
MRERIHGLGGEFRIYDASPGTAVEAELLATAPEAKRFAGDK